MNTTKWNHPHAFAEAQACNERGALIWTGLQQRDVSEEQHAGLEDKMRSLVVPGLYRHFKSKLDDQKFYVVWGIAPDMQSNNPPMVDYCALYAPHHGKRVSRSLLDPKDAFWGPINRPHDTEWKWVGARFEKIKALSPMGCAMLQINAHQVARAKTEVEARDVIARLLRKM